MLMNLLYHEHWRVLKFTRHEQVCLWSYYTINTEQTTENIFTYQLLNQNMSLGRAIFASISLINIGTNSHS